MTQTNERSELREAFCDVLRVSLLVGGAYAALFILFFIIQGFAQGTFEREFCISNKCVTNLFESHNMLFGATMIAGKVIIAMATLLTLYMAIKSYQLNHNNNKFNNHIQNLNFFMKVVTEDVEGRAELKKNDININRLYTLLFPNSQEGSFDKFEQYERRLTKLRDYVILHSNGHKKHGARKPGKDTNKFVEHRTEIRKQLLELGISVQPMQKGNFYQVERALFEFIDHITLTFTNLSPNKYLLSEVDIHYRT